MAMQMTSRPSSQAPCNGTALWILIALNLLIVQFFGFIFYQQYARNSFSSDATIYTVPQILRGGQHHPILDFPLGDAVALPSVRVVEPGDSTTGASNNDKYYGGKGDKKHLGGFANNDVDMQGVSPAAWKFMIETHGIKSMLDVGCGRGVSTSWFHLHGANAKCVEGSHDAWEQSLIPNELRTEHDFSRGPWWPSETVDAVWCVELLEHVGRNFHKNLMPAFRQAAFLYVTHSVWGGWHHVEVHSSDWWIARFQSFGFVYNEYLTKQIKDVASSHREDPAPNGKTYNAQHIWTNMLVFINPAVASLPNHAHLLSGPSCTEGIIPKGQRPCDPAKQESTLPPNFEPLALTVDMDIVWEKHVFGNTSITKN
ncbi:methyltransferase domain containing protein [Nitzschia inconspicua]|uniref:Methyltransferase domain containing protein n=1 Tax=Nitzschia inconspicua TaxID=303405 RepID=A0A9K3Q9K4_9STRA|nr:methyltransferase domain containing protein [Nitzschia inconspicua]